MALPFNIVHGCPTWGRGHKFLFFFVLFSIIFTCYINIKIDSLLSARRNFEVRITGHNENQVVVNHEQNHLLRRVCDYLG